MVQSLKGTRQNIQTIGVGDINTLNTSQRYIHHYAYQAKDTTNTMPTQSFVCLIFIMQESKDTQIAIKVLI